MAIKQEIVIEVTETGYDEVIKKSEKLANANKEVADSEQEKKKTMADSGNAVLENGGAMGLLNDITGGYAMMVKDAVEASVLFTKSQKLAAIQQKIYTLVVGTSTGAMKAFRIALISTGIGAIVVALGLLIANFDKVKKVVMNLIPGLSAIGDILGGLVDAVTDFIGVTSDASRALDKMVADSEKALKKNELYLEANGDKHDEYTRRKIQANIDYQKKVQEVNEMEKTSEEEKLKILNEFRAKANREIVKADADREAAREKIRKEAADKEAEAAKKAAEDAQRKRDEAVAKEKARVEGIQKILDDYRKREEDAAAKSNIDKINLEEKRALAELDTLKATEEEKAKIRAYYNQQRLDEEARLYDEAAAIEASKQEALRTLQLDQKQWEIDNETDPLIKLQKQRDLLEQQAEIDLEKLQADIDNAKLSAQERANAEMEYARIKQDLNQALADNDSQQAEEQKTRDEAVAQNKKDIALNTLTSLADMAGKGSEVAKGVAAAQAIQDTYKGATSAYSALAGIPIVGPALGAVAAGAAVVSGLANVKKILSTKPIEKSAPSGGGSGSGGQVPSAPAFNLVQGTGTNQIAETLANQGQTPIQAYVVANDVTTAQGLYRNSVENSKL